MKQTKHFPESCSAYSCCVRKCLPPEKSRDLCIWPSQFTDESLETEMATCSRPHGTSVAEQRPAPQSSDSS